jgi:signal transduction histidine kinase
VDAATPVEVSANPTLLSQIVTNLLVNAGEATDGKGQVAVRVTTEGGRACLEVDDDGPGVPVERRAGLFDALVTTKPHGNGMGLFSVKAAALALGGSVSVDVAPLGGARFRVTLPLRAGDAA